jgi:hypothetical protein
MPYKGLSSMRGNQHVLFLGEPQLATAVAYPALNCGCKFYPQKHVINQKYCSKPICQTARKVNWMRHKLKRDKSYKAYRKEIQSKWKANNPCYWAQYKKIFAEKTKPRKEKSYKIKISVRKNILANLAKTGVINCNCQLVLTS